MARRPAARPALAVLALAGMAAALTGVAPASAGPAAGTASAGVFKVNPVQSSGNETLTDQKDSATAVPAKDYYDVTLTNLDGSGYLRGDWANVKSETGKPAFAAPGGSYVYNRHDDQFEQVMAYYWVTQAQLYLQSLGFGGAHGDLRPVNAESQDVRINQYGADNSFSRDDNDEITFGKGGVDDAEDAEVIVHEYGHAVHDAQVAGLRAARWTPARSARRSATTWRCRSGSRSAAAPAAGVAGGLRRRLGLGVLHLDRAALPAPRGHGPHRVAAPSARCTTTARSGRGRCGTSAPRSATGPPTASSSTPSSASRPTPASPRQPRRRCRRRRRCTAERQPRRSLLRSTPAAFSDPPPTHSSTRS